MNTSESGRPISERLSPDQSHAAESTGRREDLGIETAYVPPVRATEIRLADAWKEILDLDEVGIDDNFFELGGDSLGVTRILIGIRRVWNVAIPIETFFDAATLRELAAAVDALRLAGADADRADRPVAQALTR